MALTNPANFNDPIKVRQLIQQLSHLRLGPDSRPSFTGLDLNDDLDMNDHEITNVNYIDFDLINGVAAAEGRMVWNDTDGTINIGLKGGQVNLQVGQEQVLRGKNASGSQIEDGQCVRISGASGTNPEFGLSDADTPANAGTIGMATEPISNNALGYVTTFGLVRGIDTTGTDESESWSSADRLYVSNTAGALTNVAPTGNERVIFVGIVVRSHATEGIVFVSPINVSYLQELSGVVVSNVADRDILRYSSGTSTWINTPITKLLDAFNGTFLETIDFTVAEAAGTVTGSLEQSGTGDLTQVFSDGFTILDTTPALTIDLTAYVGTNAVPKEVFVYVLQSAKTVMAASNSDWPATEHIKIANLLLKSAVTTGTDGGALVNRNWNDHAKSADGQGHLTHIEERLRQEPTQWDSGVALTLKNSAGGVMNTTDSSTAVELVTTIGTAYQLHKQTFPAFDMYTTPTDDAHITNQPTDEGGAYETTVDLVTDVTHYVDGSASGVAIGVNKYFNLVLWGVQNRDGTPSHIMINLPTSQYTTQSNAISDVDGTSVFEIPSAFKGKGFLIARLTFRLIGGSQWTYIAQEDLRGKFPDIIAGVGITTTDHALLANLAAPADDHTQYLLASGTRALAGAWDMGNQILTNVNIDSGDINNAVTNAKWDAAYTHVGSDGKNHSDVVLNNTHRASDGKDHADVVLNNTERGKVGIDVGADPGYIGAASNDGVLRTGAGLSYTDNGDSITLDYAVQEPASACSVYLGSAQAVTTSTYEPIEFDTATFDEGSEFDIVTNHKFTANATGKYFVCASISLSDLAIGDEVLMRIRKNGSSNVAFTRLANPKANTAVVISLTKAIVLTASDYITADVWHNHGSDRTAVAGDSTSYFSIHRLTR